MRARYFVIFVLLFLPVSLFAQTTGLSGFDLRLFRPPADGSGLLNLHGSRMLEPGRFSLGMVTDISHGLLQATDPATGRSLRVVNDLFTDNLHVAVGITKFFQAGVNLPTIYFERGTHLDTAQGFTTASLGDIALDLKCRLLEEAAGRPGIALVSETTFPSGDVGKFTGDSNVTEEVRLALDKGLGPVSLTVNGGYRVVERTQVVNLDIDDRVTYGAGLSWTLPFGRRGLDLLAEIDGATVVRNPRRLTSPVEWLIGLRQRIFEGLTFEVAGGRGVFGSAGGGDWRLITGVQFRTKGAKIEPAKAELLETIYFRFDRDRYLPKYESRLDAVAAKLKSSKRKVKIRGHTDSEGGEAYNLDLSKRRAEAVERALRRRGIDRSDTTVEAVGSREPAGDNRTFQGKAKNRRVEIFGIPCAFTSKR